MRRLSVLPPALRFALLPALAVALLTVLMIAASDLLTRRQLEDRSRARVEHRAALLAAQIDAALTAVRREAQTLARSPLVLPGRPADRIRVELERLREGADSVVWAGLVAADGRVLAATRGWLEGRSIATRPVFTEGLAGSYVGDVHPAVALAPLMAGESLPATELIDIGEPVRDAQGRTVAVLALHLGVGWIDRLRGLVELREPGRSDASVTLKVFSLGQARSVLPGDGLPPAMPLPPPRSGELMPTAAFDGLFYASAVLGWRGEPAMLPWRIVALQDRADALAPMQDNRRTLAAFGLLAALLVSAAGALAARRTLRPWGPLFDTVMARAGPDADDRALADAAAAVLREALPPPPPDGPEALLALLARDTRELRRVIDHLPVGLALVDRDFRVQYLNPEYTRLLGWTTEQVRGRIAAEFLFDAVERTDFLRLYAQMGDRPSEVAARFDALRPDGERVAVQWHLVPMTGPDGRMDAAIAVVHDIRPERVARARADALAGRLRALADAAVDDALATLDLEGRVLEWSRGAERLSDRAQAQALGEPLDVLLPLAAGLPAVLLAARRDGRCSLAGEVTRADGTRRWFDGSVYALGLAPGLARFGVVLRDITPQRESALALERSEARLRLALEGARIGTWEVDLDGPAPTATWSDGYAAITGLPRCEGPQEADALYALVHPDDRPLLREAMLACVREGRPLSVEFRGRHQGRWQWHQALGQAQRDAQGRATRIVGIGMDIGERKRAESEIRAGRERLERIVQTMSEGLVVLDAEGRYVLANRAAERLLAVPVPEIVGRRYDDVPWTRQRPDGRAMPASEHFWPRLRDGVAEVRDEAVVLDCPDGRRITINVNALPVRDDAGRFAGAVLTFADITEREAIAQALVDNEARLSAIVGGASDAIVSIDAEGLITLFNPASERIFGRRAVDMLAQPLAVLLPDAARRNHGRHLQDFARSGVTRRPMGVGRVQGLRADGRQLELEASISQATVRGRTMMTAILRDVTDRVAQERLLESTRADLSDLTLRLLEQEKLTTRRLAQALHDELGQTLTALRLHWEALQGADAGHGPALRERLTQLMETANRQIRGVLGELRPPLLDESGLAAALDNEMQQRRPVGGLPRLQLQVPPRLHAQRWPADVEYAAFMVGREALVNALHHAQAAEVVLALEGDDGQLLMSVRDDGVGPTPPEAGPGVRPGRLGLVGMRERALAIGATLHIEGRPGRGTIVTLQWNAEDEPDLPGR